MFSNLSHYIHKYRFKSIYARMFIIFSLLLSCVIFAVGGFSYFIASDSIQKKVNESELKSLLQSQKAIDSILEEANLITINLASHYLLQKDFEEYDLKQKITAGDDLFSSIKKDDFIDSIYIYYSISEKILSSTKTVISASFFPDMDWLDAYKKSAPLGLKSLYLGNRVTGAISSPPKTEVLTILREFPLSSMPKKGVIVINLNQKKLFENISRLSPGDKALLVIDNNSKLLYGDSRYMEQLKEQNIYDKIYNNIVNGQTGFQTAVLDNTHIMISGVHSGQSKWMYINLQDINYITSDANMIKRLTLILALICLLGGAFVWMLVFMNFYSPIIKLLNRSIGSTTNAAAYEAQSTRNEFELLNKVVDTVIESNRNLEEIHKGSRDEIKKGLLMNLCSGDIYDREHISKLMNMVGFETEANELLAIMAVKFTDYKKLSEKYSAGELSQYKEEIRKIADNGNLPGYKTLSGFIENDKLVCLVSYQGNENTIISIANTLYKQIKDTLHSNIIIGIGSSSRDIYNMHISFHEALDAIGYRVLSGEGEVIHINHFDILGKTPKYFYPLHKEKALIDSIKLGDSEQAIKIIREVFNGIPKCAETASYISELLWQLMNGLFRGINSMGIKYEDVFEKNFFESYQEYRHKAKIEDMLQFIEDQITCLTVFINNRRVSIKDKVIENIKDYIRKNYKENISLTDVASMVYMSSAYISAAFKDATGENFTEYLAKVRIEKAIELLMHTGKDIDSISSKVGYESRSFQRAFKKYTGMTPTDYRKKMGLEALSRAK